MISIHKIDVVALLKPRINCDQAVAIIKKIGMDKYVRVETDGYAGGIWVCGILTLFL